MGFFTSHAGRRVTLLQMTVLAKRIQSQGLCIWMPCEDDVNEGSAAYDTRTVLDIFPKMQGLLDFRGFFEVTVLY